jgi:hypothetical protein
MHPSIQLRIESTRLNYYPPALDIQKSWTSITKPKWEFIERKAVGEKRERTGDKREGAGESDPILIH